MPPMKPRSASCGRFHLSTTKRTRVFLTTPEDIDGFTVIFSRGAGVNGYWRGDGVNAVAEGSVNTSDLWTVVVRFRSGIPPVPVTPDFRADEGLALTVINPTDENHPSDPLAIVGVIIP